MSEPGASESARNETRRSGQRDDSYAGFRQFCAARAKDLARIAWRTGGEHHKDDVENEAWGLAQELRIDEGVAIDFIDPEYQGLLIAHLYQRLVRYTELNVRYAVRLDHPARGEDTDESCHPLLRTLAADEGSHPLTALLEEQAPAPDMRELEHSLAGAYVVLLRHFDNRMRDVAEHLLISRSYAYRRCAQARLSVTRQRSLALRMCQEKFLPGPWRRFKLRRNASQLSFNFFAVQALWPSELSKPSFEASSPSHRSAALPDEIESGR